MSRIFGLLRLEGKRLILFDSVIDFLTFDLMAQIPLEKPKASELIALHISFISMAL